MLRSFLAWLDEFVAEKGVFGLASSALGILAFGGAISVVFGGTITKVAAVVVVMLLILGVFSALIAEQVKAKNRYRRAERLLARYCEKLEQSWRVLSWDQYTEISANGDTVEGITVKIVVEGDRLDFFRIQNGATHPETERQRRRVKAEASTVNIVDGTSSGTSGDMTSSWLANGRLEVLAHCHIPTQRGSVISLRLDYNWPGKCAPLVKGEVEEFMLHFRKGAESIKYTVVLPDNRETRHEFIDPQHYERYHIASDLDPSRKRRFVRIDANNVQPNEYVGMRLEVRKG
jgi:hypothetical protein